MILKDSEPVSEAVSASRYTRAASGPASSCWQEPIPGVPQQPVRGYSGPSAVGGSKSTELRAWPLATCVNECPSLRQERCPFLNRVVWVDLSMRWLGLVLCLLWLGWRLQALWQWSQRQWRLDPLSNEFQQELRRRGLVGVLP